jgi:hypothetical protein
MGANLLTRIGACCHSALRGLSWAGSGWAAHLETLGRLSRCVGPKPALCIAHPAFQVLRQQVVLNELITKLFTASARKDFADDDSDDADLDDLLLGKYSTSLAVSR